MLTLLLVCSFLLSLTLSDPLIGDIEELVYPTLPYTLRGAFGGYDNISQKVFILGGFSSVNGMINNVMTHDFVANQIVIGQNISLTFYSGVESSVTIGRIIYFITGWECDVQGNNCDQANRIHSYNMETEVLTLDTLGNIPYKHSWHDSMICWNYNPSNATIFLQTPQNKMQYTSVHSPNWLIGPNTTVWRRDGFCFYDEITDFLYSGGGSTELSHTYERSYYNITRHNLSSFTIVNDFTVYNTTFYKNRHIVRLDTQVWYTFGGWNSSNYPRYDNRIVVINTEDMSISLSDVLTVYRFIGGMVVNVNGVIYIYGGLRNLTAGSDDLSIIQRSFPTDFPTLTPTVNPTINPTILPTITPTYIPSINTLSPTIKPTIFPSKTPTQIPTFHPTLYPTFYPTFFPTNSKKQQNNGLDTATLVIVLIILILTLVIGLFLIWWCTRFNKTIKHRDNLIHLSKSQNDNKIEVKKNNSSEPNELVKIEEPTAGNNDISLKKIVENTHLSSVTPDGEDDHEIELENLDTNQSKPLELIKINSNSQIEEIIEEFGITPNGMNSETIDDNIGEQVENEVGNSEINQILKDEAPKKTPGQFKNELADQNVVQDMILDDVVEEMETDR